MHKHVSVFDTPTAEKKFCKYLEEKQKKEFEHFKIKEKRIFGDNLSEQIINKVFES
jgi:predicted nucleic acid-binding OB-fold protein